MMKRAAKRVYREHGIKYFAFPVVVVLLLASLFDEHIDGYLEKREEVFDQQMTAENNQSVLALDANISASHDKLEPDFGPLAQKWFVDAEAPAATQKMQAQVQQMLQSLYFSDIQWNEPQQQPLNSVASRISISAHFNGVPQQLPRLQAALARLPKRVDVDNLELRVVPDPQRGGQQLDIRLRLSSLHFKPMPEGWSSVTASSSKKTNPSQNSGKS